MKKRVNLAEVNNKQFYIMLELQKKINDLQIALKEKTISVNEYSTMYYNTYQQIKNIQQ